MKIKARQYAAALYGATVGKDKEEINQVIKKFVFFLIKKNSVKLSREIIRQFKDYYSQKEKVADAKLISTEVLSKDVVAQITKALPALLQNKFNKFNVTQEIDPSLIGGLVIECGDLIFDNSVKNRLRILKDKLQGIS